MNMTKNLKTKLHPIFFGLIFANISIAGDIKTIQISSKEIQKEGIMLPSDLTKAIRFNDADGAQLLLFTKLSMISKKQPNQRRIERHEIKVVNLKKTSRGWVKKWAVNDAVDCPNLDSEANFFLENISVTDVNNDGFAEVSVPYNLFCGGGVDPKTIKIIMRTKSEKYALRGESKIVIPGQDSFGGDMQMDASLQQQKNTAFKDLLVKIWDSIYIEKR